MDWLDQAERDLERARLDLRFAYYESTNGPASRVGRRRKKRTGCGIQKVPVSFP